MRSPESLTVVIPDSRMGDVTEEQLYHIAASSKRAEAVSVWCMVRRCVLSRSLSWMATLAVRLPFVHRDSAAPRDGKSFFCNIIVIEY